MVVVNLRSVFTRTVSVTSVRQRFNTVSMVTDIRMGSRQPIRAIKFTVTIDTMVNFEGTVILTLLANKSLGG